ncbi:MAG: ABC transporter ATP-binding protein [Cyclobacteriaceae bacterium]|nr:ABC transporter ATP-binding protein [Cyclobacteriaceae bacterium]
MDIRLDKLSKRFKKEWIVKGLTLEIPAKTSLAITGANGSGKTTLLKIISSYMDATSGQVIFHDKEKEIQKETALSQISYAAPYINLIEEMSLKEHLDFHFRFRKNLLPLTEIARRSGLEKAVNKRVSEFSSGMKQRLKLALAIFSESNLLLLDEPTSNLDEYGIKWYQEEIREILGTKTILIASNQRYEYDFVQQILTITDHR